MTNDRKIQLGKLLKKNKLKQAKIQLIEDLKNYHEIDISNKEFVDFPKSEEVHKKVYDRIKTDEIQSFKFPYDEETIKSQKLILFLITIRIMNRKPFCFILLHLVSTLGVVTNFILNIQLPLHYRF